MTSRPTTRAEQRRSTEERILTAARAVFAEVGYDRATVRAIASRAGADPGLVMRYFGSKEDLFTRAVPLSAEEPPEGVDDLVERLLASLGAKLASEPTELLAMLRSMLSRPDAAREVRVFMTGQQEQAADAIGGEDATVRAGLVGAITIGTVIARHLLRLDGVTDAPHQQLVDRLRPAFRTLLDGPSPR